MRAASSEIRVIMLRELFLIQSAGCRESRRFVGISPGHDPRLRSIIVIC